MYSVNFFFVKNWSKIANQNLINYLVIMHIDMYYVLICFILFLILQNLKCTHYFEPINLCSKEV